MHARAFKSGLRLDHLLHRTNRHWNPLFARSFDARWSLGILTGGLVRPVDSSTKIKFAARSRAARSFSLAAEMLPFLLLSGVRPTSTPLPPFCKISEIIRLEGISSQGLHVKELKCQVPLNQQLRARRFAR